MPGTAACTPPLALRENSFHFRLEWSRTLRTMGRASEILAPQCSFQQGDVQVLLHNPLVEITARLQTMDLDSITMRHSVTPSKDSMGRQSRSRKQSPFPDTVRIRTISPPCGGVKRNCMNSDSRGVDKSSTRFDYKAYFMGEEAVA